MSSSWTRAIGRTMRPLGGGAAPGSAIAGSGAGLAPRISPGIAQIDAEAQRLTDTAVRMHELGLDVSKCSAVVKRDPNRLLATKRHIDRDMWKRRRLEEDAQASGVRRKNLTQTHTLLMRMINLVLVHRIQYSLPAKFCCEGLMQY